MCRVGARPGNGPPSGRALADSPSVRAIGFFLAFGISAAAAEPSLVKHADADHPLIGLMADVGVPDAATLSLAVRPVRALRVELGMAHDVVGPGVRAGVTWIPLRWWATPVVGIGYGHFFERDANPLVRTIDGSATFSSPLLDHVGYDFAIARAGLELGRKRFTFFLHAGVARVSTEIRGVAEASNAAAQRSGSMVTVSSTDPEVRIWTVSANVGFILYLH